MDRVLARTQPMSSPVHLYASCLCSGCGADDGAAAVHIMHRFPLTFMGHLPIGKRVHAPLLSGAITSWRVRFGGAARRACSRSRRAWRWRSS
eukprot:scaffold55295_cov27-Tisochrysis_lutea.AAC.1